MTGPVIHGAAKVSIGGADGRWQDLGHIADGNLLLDVSDGGESDRFVMPKGSVTQSMTFTLDQPGRDALKAWYGPAAGRRDTVIPVPPKPAYAVTYEYVDWVSGEPRRPQLAGGFFAWLFRWQAHADRLWVIKRRAWVRAGCPDVPATYRVYIPHAHLTIKDN